MLKSFFFTVIGLLFFLYGHAETASQQLHQALTQRASVDLQEELSSYYGDKVTFDYALPINPDLDHYPVCQEPLHIERITQKRGLSPINRFRYHISCQTPSFWKTTVTLRPNIYLPIVIAQKRIEREQIITQDDVALLPYNIRLLSGEFSTELNETIGMRAKKRVAAGIPITKALLLPPLLVKRGEHIILLTENGHVLAEMTVEAMSDGALDDVINVKHPKSGKIISAQVVAQGKVKTVR